jgi:HTH-type transcriptional regulator, competence development regulator
VLDRFSIEAQKPYEIQAMRGDRTTMPDTDPARANVTLGKYLAAIRADRRLTLRQVEEATEKEVSNAYLSQLENERISKPSPNILHALAALYGVDYGHLMELAGYVTASKRTDDSKRHGRVATFSEFNLTNEEEAQILDYLKFIRQRKPPNG